MSLNHFLKRLLIFGLIAFPLVSAQSLLSYYTLGYEKEVNGREVYVSLKKSNIRKKVRVLIIGDSVGKQLYDNDTYNDDIFSLTTNQAISMAGQYILVKNFIERNIDQLPKTIILIITPGSFGNNLDQVFTFQYFLKPFYKKNYIINYNQATLSQIHKVPFYYFSQLPCILNTNWSPEYPKNNGQHAYKLLSPISNDYLFKIKELCARYSIVLDIKCPPIKKANTTEIQNYKRALFEFRKVGLEAQMKIYFNSIVFKPDSLYQDPIHFKKQFIPKDYLNLL